ncbi:MAG: hypothetical protein ACM3PZ_03175 [Bacillota bacterium]
MEALLYFFVLAVLAFSFLHKEKEKLAIIATFGLCAFVWSLLVGSANPIPPLVLLAALCTVAVSSKRYTFRAISSGIYLLAAMFLCSSQAVSIGPVIWTAILLIIVLSIHRFGDKNAGENVS